MLTFEEIRDTILVRMDVQDLIEMLDISAEELLDRFEDRAMLKQEELEEYIDESN